MAYFERTIVTPTLAESGPAEALIETIRATRALNELFYRQHVAGVKDDAEFAEGAHQLLETQCLILAGAHAAMEAEDVARAAERQAAEQAAVALKARAEDSVRLVRRDFIIAQTQAGVDPMTIAQALGMKIANVALVVASAVAEGAIIASAAAEGA